MSAYHGQIKSRYIPSQYSLYTDQDHCSAVRRERARKDRTASDRRRTHADLYQFTGYGNTPFLQELETKALADRVPIIRRDMQSLYEDASGTETTEAHFEVGTAVASPHFLCVSMGRKIWKLLP